MDHVSVLGDVLMQAGKLFTAIRMHSPYGTSLHDYNEINADAVLCLSDCGHHLYEVGRRIAEGDLEHAARNTDWMAGELHQWATNRPEHFRATPIDIAHFTATLEHAMIAVRASHIA